MNQEQSSASREEERQDQPQDMSQRPETEGDEQQSRGADSAAGKARKQEDEVEAAKEEMRRLEKEGPPEKLEDWPTGKAKYETFGGPEGQDHAYHEGPEQQLGPDSLRHREDGSVEVAGDEVDDPSEYKGEPIPGGPTDPDTPNLRMDKASPEEASVNRDEGAGNQEEAESRES